MIHKEFVASPLSITDRACDFKKKTLLECEFISFVFVILGSYFPDSSY